MKITIISGWLFLDSPNDGAIALPLQLLQVGLQGPESGDFTLKNHEFFKRC